MGALTQPNAESLAIKFVSTRGPPPFFDSLAQLAIFREAKSTVLKAFKTEDGSIDLLIILGKNKRG
jgi:hypothetical protein